MRQTLAILRIAALVAWAVVLVSGCSRTSGRHMNISAGEYYSEEEYEKLSRKEKEAYCLALSSELSQLKSNMEEKGGKLEATKEEIESLKEELSPIESELLKIDSDVRTLKRQIAEMEALPKTWRIQPGECLWIISGHEEIYADPVKWPRIYRANKNKIEDPEYIYPDTVLVIPRDWPTEHQVVPEECLWLISGYWEIYDNPLDWTKIYEANKDRLKDPDLIMPDQVLTIPR